MNRQFLLKMLADKQVKADTLINPKGKQNVAAAVNLLKLINQLTENNNEGINYDIYKEYQLISKTGALLLCIFNDTHIDLSKQPCNLSLAAHLLLFIYRKQKTNFLTNDLYYDIQETIQDAYVCAAKMIKNKQIIRSICIN